MKRVTDDVEHYNNVRLHSAIDYVTPADKLAGRAGKIVDARDRKLEEAGENRRAKRLAARRSEVATLAG